MCIRDRTEGALFATKEVLIAAVKHAHISTDRNFIVEKSSTQVYKVKCVVSNCKWKLRAAKKKSHGLFQITKCPEIHTCLLDRPTQDHCKISAKMIGYVVAPYVSPTTLDIIICLNIIVYYSSLMLIYFVSTGLPNPSIEGKQHHHNGQ